MRKTFKASRLMVLVAIVFGVMAFGGTAAQAEPGAHWNVNGNSISSALKVEGQGETESSGAFLTTVGASKIEISCTSIKAVNVLLGELGSGSGKGHVEGCTTKLNGSLAKNCKPKSPGATSGLIETNTLDALIKLHTLEGGAKDDLVELLPTTGTAFVTVELGPLCAIGNKFDITGKAFVKDGTNEGLVDKIKHLVEEGPLTALLFGSNAATIDGSAFVFLVGAHEGMTVSGTAN
ncbi:MAG: hypothetical protein QOF13_1505 [Solirubrobacterales bacterium]|jgi:hypothetical protein|nr:hypothetical protein [Solirubrobacterales bacterium]